LPVNGLFVQQISSIQLLLLFAVGWAYTSSDIQLPRYLNSIGCLTN